MRTRSICLLALVAAACTPRINTDPATGRVDVDMEPVTQRGQVWETRLAGQGSYGGVTGTARATVTRDHTTATAMVSGATPGAEHPWHVHEGSCATGGPIVGPATAYPPLNIGSEGRASADAHLVGVELNEAKQYHVNVHDSPTNMGTIVACGDLSD